jgi:hypothetical protein
MLTVNTYTKKFEESHFQAHLDNLYSDLAGQDPEAWAKQLYITLRDNPTNELACALNQDRKACLKFLYDLMNDMENSPDPQVFEQEIVNELQVWRIKKILDICLVMDRCQSLYKMRIPTSSLCGMHWYSNLHLNPNTPYGKAFPEELQFLAALLNSTNYEGSATMNKRLFKLLYNESFGLLNDPKLARWSRPAPATFVKLPVSQSHPTASQPHPLAAAAGKPEPLTTASPEMCSLVQRFAHAYDQPAYQASLARLYHDRGSQDPEEWARELYITFRYDPFNPRALTLNQDRKICLELLYEMVNEWEKHRFSREFEQAIADVFEFHRILRILGVCLIMDRCQALHKMELTSTTGAIFGMHWFCELHFRGSREEGKTGDTMFSAEELQKWNQLLSGYSGRGTMNKRLYRLLYSDTLGLRQNELIARWSKPQEATFVKKES